MNASGDRAWTVPVGADALMWTDIGKDACVESKEQVKLAHSISTSPVMVGDLLAVDFHDPAAELPPGTLLDPVDGTELLSLGVGEVNGATMAAMADLVPAGDGYLVAGSPDGDLWSLDAKGRVVGHIIAEDLVPVGDDSTINIKAIGYSATGDSYLAASFLSVYGVWAVAL